jgi:DNA adenine methylase
MSAAASPLRYPGGKQALTGTLAGLLRGAGHEDGVYVEPYAGGAGAALSLLFGEYVRELLLNDADFRVYAFWRAALFETEHLLRLIHDTPVTVKQWDLQRRIYRNAGQHSTLKVGFATFFLNRCNRSGIIGNGGIIGGRSQAGRWKIDVRFNKEELARRIERIALYSNRIHVFNMDGIKFLHGLSEVAKREASYFVYLDPPYFAKGQQLYLNYYTLEDHKALASYLATRGFAWAMTYDDVPEIRDLYRTKLTIPIKIHYSARKVRSATELLILPQAMREVAVGLRLLTSSGNRLRGSGRHARPRSPSLRARRRT